MVMVILHYWYAISDVYMYLHRYICVHHHHIPQYNTPVSLPLHTIPIHTPHTTIPVSILDFHNSPQCVEVFA